MKYDLLLTGTGDLSFVSSNSKSKNEVLELNFHIAPTDSLCFKFNITNTNKDMIILDKHSKPSRLDLEVETLDDIDYIINAKVGMRIYIKDTKQVVEVLNVESIIHLNEDGSEEVLSKISYYNILNYSFSGNLKYDFYTFTPKFDKTSRVVKDREYMQQAIKLRLSTELNTVAGNESLGSALHEYVHSNMAISRLLINISQQVKSSISDILPNCEVTAYIINSDYLNYHDSIKIVIVNNEETYYYYI